MHILGTMQAAGVARAVFIKVVKKDMKEKDQWLFRLEKPNFSRVFPNFQIKLDPN